MGKKIQKFQAIKVLERKEDKLKGYIYLIEFSNGEKKWLFQRNINKTEIKKLLKEFDKKFPKIEKRGRKKKIKILSEKDNEEIKNSTEPESQNNNNNNNNNNEKEESFYLEIKKENYINNNNNELSNEELKNNFIKFESEINSLKKENAKLKDELNKNSTTYNNLSEWLFNISKENEKLKDNLKNKCNELCLIKQKFCNNNNNETKEQQQIILSKDQSQDLNNLYFEQKLENNNLKLKIQELIDKKNNLTETYQILEKNKEEILKKYIQKNKSSNEILKKKDSIILELNKKIIEFEEKEKLQLMNSKEKINKEVEIWKQKYEDLNDEYGKITDILKVYKNKNKELNSIYEQYKNKFGEIESQ